MNKEDKQRFARYYPGYVEPPECDNDNNDANDANDGNGNDNSKEKKNILGYIEKIDIDKDKLIIDAINTNNTTNNTK